MEQLASRELSNHGIITWGVPPACLKVGLMLLVVPESTDKADTGSRHQGGRCSRI